MVDIKYVVFFSTFIVFSLESFLHFNIGKNGLKRINIPTALEACEIIGVVLLFSGIMANYAYLIAKGYTPKSLWRKLWKKT